MISIDEALAKALEHAEYAMIPAPPGSDDVTTGVFLHMAGVHASLAETYARIASTLVVRQSSEFQQAQMMGALAAQSTGGRA